MTTLFESRYSAGQQLASSLADYQERPDTLVIGIARHGIPVAAGLANELSLNLDMLTTLPILHRHRRLGVMAGQGSFALDPVAMERANLRQGEFTRLLNDTRASLQVRTHAYRTRTTPHPVNGKTIILVDDVIDSGLTLKAALKAVQHLQPGRIVVAIPTGCLDIIDKLRHQVDALVCLSLQAGIIDVPSLYQEARQPADDLLEHWLQSAAMVLPLGAPSTTTTSKGPLWNPVVPFTLSVRAQWSAYFRDFTQAHDGWRISLKIFNLAAAREQRTSQWPLKASRLIRKPIEMAPLINLSYDATSDRLIVEYQEGVRLRQWPIDQPLRISCREQLGHRKELRVENQQGTLFSLQLIAAQEASVPFTGNSHSHESGYLG